MSTIPGYCSNADRGATLWQQPILKVVGLLIAALLVLSACGGSSSTTGTGGSSQPKTPIKIGISLSFPATSPQMAKPLSKGTNCGPIPSTKTAVYLVARYNWTFSLMPAAQHRSSQTIRN